MPRGGARAGAGAKPKAARLELEAVLNKAVTAEDRMEIFNMLTHRAKAGDSNAAKLVLGYIYGTPIQRQEVTGESGGPLKVIVEYADIDPPEAA